jgi:hypothetical protein
MEDRASASLAERCGFKSYPLPPDSSSLKRTASVFESSASVSHNFVHHQYFPIFFGREPNRFPGGGGPRAN